MRSGRQASSGDVSLVMDMEAEQTAGQSQDDALHGDWSSLPLLREGHIPVHGVPDQLHDGPLFLVGSIVLIVRLCNGPLVEAAIYLSRAVQYHRPLIIWLGLRETVRELSLVSWLELVEGCRQLLEAALVLGERRRRSVVIRFGFGGRLPMLPLLV